MTDEQYFLASAYLDGELTSAERARAEADPEVMATVAELGDVAHQLAAVPASSAETRAAALAAALREFDAQPAVTRAVAPRSATRRRLPFAWQRHYLAIAAAVVAVAALGTVLVIGSGRNHTDQSADLATSTAVAKQPVGTNPTPLDQTANGGAAELASAATEMAGGSSTQPASQLPMASLEVGAAISPIADPDLVLSTPEELTGRGLYLLQEVASGQFTATPEGSCTFSQALNAPLPDGELAPGVTERADLVGVLAEATYLLDGTQREVLLAVDPDTGQTFALDPGTCQVLVIGAY